MTEVAVTTEEVIIKDDEIPDREIIEQIINGEVIDAKASPSEEAVAPVKKSRAKPKAKAVAVTITKEDIMEA
eukprot:14186013-Heterocapsa_arctica.AAC.1